jgi:exonuclease III
MRVLTLNVNGLPWSRLPPLRQRAAQFCRLIESSDVDIACFQEVWTRSALAALRPGLPTFRHVAAGRGPFGPAGGLAVFSRRPLGSVRYASFLGVVPPAGGFGFRTARAINSAMQGALVVAVPDAGLTVATTHLTANHDGDWSRANRHCGFQRAQLLRVRAAVDRAGGAGVLVGDFNIASDGPLYPLIVDGWQDPFADSDPPTFQGAFLPDGGPGKRIDYLLVRGARVSDCATVFVEPLPSGEYLSDHIGLTADVKP